MAGAKLLSTRLTFCVACGHESRLVAATSEEVISRCYACGDVTRTPHQVRPAWSAEAGIRGYRQQGTETTGPMKPRSPVTPDRVAAG
jgi:uncharacterized Zn finger protein